MGDSAFQVDGNGNYPIDIALDVGCVPAVSILLKGDCLPFLALNTRDGDIALPRAFRKVSESDDTRLHDLIIECLLRHKFLLPKLLPYHDLATERWANNIKFAQKVFDVGFQDIEAYNNSGYTPLMVACQNGNIRMASFLLQHGADPCTCHKHVGLRAGHFLCYDGRNTVFNSYCAREDGFISKDDEKRLLEAAFDTSIDVESRCRCSPDGFSPITSLFQGRGLLESIHDVKKSFQRLICSFDSSPADRKRYWRAFIVNETFNRLGMTHTCIKLHSADRLFPDCSRIEIEEEEVEYFFKLEEIVARFDLFSERFGDDLSICVDEFFDDLDGDLRPKGLFGFVPTWNDTDPDCLGPGESLYVKYFQSSRGQVMKYGYKEITKEDAMLRWLFP